MPTPPWQQFPATPAADIAWRMGVGEEYLQQIAGQLQRLDPAQRRDLIQSWQSIPEDWMLWAAEWYAWPDDSEDALDEAWQALSGD